MFCRVNAYKTLTFPTGRVYRQSSENRSSVGPYHPKDAHLHHNTLWIAALEVCELHVDLVIAAMFTWFHHIYLFTNFYVYF